MGFALPSGTDASIRPRAIGGYEIARKIGEGRTACVYLGRDVNRRSRAALKVLKSDRMADPALWRRFAGEWAVLHSISDDNVVRVYDHGVEDERAYIAMEYLDGGTLRNQLDAGISPDRAGWLLRQAASGLAATHRRSLVHRDVKPENLLLRGSNEVVLADFGVAAEASSLADAVPHRTMFGSAAYAAPEQMQGGAVSAASDVYGLGVVFFELLCGRRPFDGWTRLEVISQHLAAPIPRLPVPLAPYQPLIDRMLEKKQTRRLPDGDAVLDFIERIPLGSHCETAGTEANVGTMSPEVDIETCDLQQIA